MHSASQAAFHTLRDYLNSLLSPTHPDQAMDEVPADLLPELEAFAAKQSIRMKPAGA
jgi:hypothetical protein